jgi:N-acyl-D-aspartate/D-glutamate deacylase
MRCFTNKYAIWITIGFIASAFFVIQSSVSQRMKYDIVIGGGRVMDPETGLDAINNIGISGDTITRITPDSLEGASYINARGLVVAPGFIELFQHAHDQESY